LNLYYDRNNRKGNPAETECRTQIKLGQEKIKSLKKTPTILICDYRNTNFLKKNMYFILTMQDEP